MLKAAWVATVTASLVLLAQDRPLPVPHTVQPVTLLSVTDGDTYWVQPDVRWEIRLSNADTWESRSVRRTGSGSITKAEIAKGKAATAAVEQLLKSGKLYLDVEHDPKTGEMARDNFGRLLGRVIVKQQDGTVTDVGVWLTANGHVRN